MFSHINSIFKILQKVENLLYVSAVFNLVLMAINVVFSECYDHLCGSGFHLCQKQNVNSNQHEMAHMTHFTNQ